MALASPRWQCGPTGRIVGHMWFDPIDGTCVDLGDYYGIIFRAPLFDNTCHGTIAEAKQSYTNKTTKTDRQNEAYAHLHARPECVYTEMRGYDDVYERYSNFLKHRLAFRHSGDRVLGSIGEDFLGPATKSGDGWSSLISSAQGCYI